jgi:phosphoribosylanthranilate isomerase
VFDRENENENQPRPLVKFCGLARPGDALAAARLGADFLGFVFSPESERRVSPGEAGTFETGSAKRVGVFVNESPEETLAAVSLARLDYVQFHGAQTTAAAEIAGPGRVIRAIWPERFRNPRELERELREWEDFAAYFLFDAGLSGGGHGRAIDLDSLSFLGLTKKKSFLAGGLTPENVKKLWPRAEKNLVGFDFNSGVETAPGMKDEKAMARVMETFGKKGRGSP